MAPLNRTRIDECLARLLQSPEFERAGRLRSFLQHVVQEYLAGRGAELKEYSIAVAVYKKPPDFDPRTDALVRVGASKLRARLDTYYAGTGQADSIRITIPKGAYEPVFEERTEQPRPTRRRWPLIAAALSLIGALGTMLYSRSTKEPAAQPKLIQVTDHRGAEADPSFSPDGTAVAFSGELHESGNEDIYIQKLGSNTVLRLTSDPARDSRPAWSPDGRSVAFVRDEGVGGAVYLVPSTGGPEKKLAHVNLGGLAWTPDGLYLSALHRPTQLDPPSQYLIEVATGAMRPLTPTSNSIDYTVAFSPDGKFAALSRCASLSRCDLYVSSVNKDHTIVEPVRRLTRLNEILQGMAWTGDSRDILFSSGYYNSYQLYRIDAHAPNAHPVKIRGVPNVPFHPSIPLRGPGSLQRVALEVAAADENLYAAPVPRPDAPAAPPRALQSSPSSDWQPELSPDGKSLVFLSDRDGAMKAWISDADGGNARALPNHGCRLVLYPHWSPDGEEVLFACFLQTDAGEDRAIYTVRRDGTYFLRISPPEHQATEPSWSQDGKWIYYAATTKTSQHQLWKSPRGGGGRPVQITKAGGYRGIEAHGVVYYTSTGDGLWAVNPTGGNEHKVLPEAHDSAWYPVADGILFTTRIVGKPGFGKELAHWNANTGAVRILGPLPHPDLLLFTVNAAGTEIIYHRTDRSIRDIVVLENYQGEN
ncbi:MAG: hypothetical protein U0R19_15905 [Bryobacteraceae bacterium]